MITDNSHKFFLLHICQICLSCFYTKIVYCTFGICLSRFSRAYAVNWWNKWHWFTLLYFRNLLVENLLDICSQLEKQMTLQVRIMIWKGSPTRGLFSVGIHTYLNSLLGVVIEIVVRPTMVYARLQGYNMSDMIVFSSQGNKWYVATLMSHWYSYLLYNLLTILKL